MKYRNFHEEKISQLGFGAMRLPVVNGIQSDIDMKATQELLMYAFEHGVNYYDTAYVYHGERSEEALGEIFENNRIRDKVNIATKLPTRTKAADADFFESINKQLKRLRTDYIDFYLIHSLDRNKWNALKQRSVKDFMDKIKKSGLIRYMGFSFHDDCDAFKSILDDYDWDFAQIQFNFFDTEYQAGVEGLEYAGRKGVPIVVMEPLRGGQLASIDDQTSESLKEKYGVSDKTLAQISFKFVYDRPEILTVLSGMNNMENLKENIQTASQSGVGELTENERGFLEELKKYIESKSTIACTACRYCTSDCPVEIDIPGVFGRYNDAMMFNAREFNARMLKAFHSNSADCIECGQCESACPQNLKIPELLKEAAKYLEL